MADKTLPAMPLVHGIEDFVAQQLQLLQVRHLVAFLARGQSVTVRRPQLFRLRQVLGTQMGSLVFLTIGSLPKKKQKN